MSEGPPGVMSNSDSMEMDVDEPVMASDFRAASWDPDWGAPRRAWDPDSQAVVLPAPGVVPPLSPASLRTVNLSDPPLWMTRLSGRRGGRRAPGPQPRSAASRPLPEQAAPSMISASLSIPEVSEAEQRALVHSYLVHHCYGRTATLLEESSGCSAGATLAPASCSGTSGRSEASSSRMAAAMVDSRLPIIQAVLNGTPLVAVGMAIELQSDLFLKRRDVLFDLMCLEYVNLVRARRVDEAITFAQKELSPFGYGKNSQVGKLEECLALLAYDDPAASPLGGYLSDDHRQGVADSLNGALLEAADLPSRAPLERIVQQLTVAMDGSGQQFRFGDWVQSVDA